MTDTSPEPERSEVIEIVNVRKGKRPVCDQEACGRPAVYADLKTGQFSCVAPGHVLPVPGLEHRKVSASTLKPMSARIVDGLLTPAGLAGLYTLAWLTDRTRHHAALCAIQWGVMVLFVTVLDSWLIPRVNAALDRRRASK